MSRIAIESIGIPDQSFNWIPGEMVVIVRLPRRPADDALDLLVEQVRSQLNAALISHSLVLETYGTHGRWLDTAAIPPMPTVRRRAFIFGLHRQQPLVAIFFHARHTDPLVEDATPMTLSFLQAQLEQLAQAGLHVLSAMPNWLVTAAPVLYGEGGPALPPRPAPKLDLPGTANTPVGWRVSFVDQGIPLDPNGAQEVLVAVLDTAHPPDRLQRAANFSGFRRNLLLQRLNSNLQSANGSFEIEYDRYPVTGDVRTGRDFRNDSRFYFMPDHGLFVAGLIRDIAPRARIRLIRVLNDFGGGDLYCLFAALTDLEQELVSGSIRRLVINLSLTIMPDIRRLPYLWFYDRQWPTPQLPGAIRVLSHIEEGLRLLFESLYAHGALIVAAAGNDSLRAYKDRQPPRPPRAPARYETTLSVTSVNSRFAPSAFANAASMPPYNAGVATFGGDGYASMDANRWPDAVRGVFITPKFPGGDQNTSGWADWCGSSFATSIISAFGAHLLAQGWSATNTINRIATSSERRQGKLFGSSPDAPDLLANIVRVQQRFKG
ncbi:MAG TPA: S8/S53 family peptidase [Ktedonobacteraceae bacterium]|nr:S8/S53 family peptidase [Ktedonobacteraceae bacterium]